MTLAPAQNLSSHFSLIFSQKYCQIEIDIDTLMIENNFLNKREKRMKNFRTLGITVGLLGLSLFIYTLQAMHSPERIPQAPPQQHHQKQPQLNLQEQIQARQAGLKHTEPQPRPEISGAKDPVHKKIDEYSKYAQDVLKEDPLRPHQIKAKDEADRIARQKAERLAQEEAERLALEKKRKQMDEIEVDLSVKPRVKTNLSEEEIFAAMQKKQREDLNTELEQVKDLGVVTKTLADEEKVTTLSKPFIKEGPENAPSKESAGMSTGKKAAIAGTTAAGLSAAGLIAAGGVTTALAGLAAAEGAGGTGVAAAETAEVGVSLGDDIAGSAIGFEEI